MAYQTSTFEKEFSEKKKKETKIKPPLKNPTSNERVFTWKNFGYSLFWTIAIEFVASGGGKGGTPLPLYIIRNPYEFLGCFIGVYFGGYIIFKIKELWKKRKRISLHTSWIEIEER